MIGRRTHAKAYMWRTGTGSLLPFFHHVGPRDQTQFITLGRKHHHMLYHLAGPRVTITKSKGNGPPRDTQSHQQESLTSDFRGFESISKRGRERVSSLLLLLLSAAQPTQIKDSCVQIVNRLCSRSACKETARK